VAWNATGGGSNDFGWIWTPIRIQGNNSSTYMFEKMFETCLKNEKSSTKKLKSGKICTSLTGSIKKFHNVSTDLNGARTIAAVCGRNGHSHIHRRLEQ